MKARGRSLSRVIGSCFITCSRGGIGLFGDRVGKVCFKSVGKQTAFGSVRRLIPSRFLEVTCGRGEQQVFT